MCQFPAPILPTHPSKRRHYFPNLFILWPKFAHPPLQTQILLSQTAHCLLRKCQLTLQSQPASNLPSSKPSCYHSNLSILCSKPAHPSKPSHYHPNLLSPYSKPVHPPIWTQPLPPQAAFCLLQTWPPTLPNFAITTLIYPVPAPNLSTYPSKPSNYHQTAQSLLQTQQLPPQTAHCLLQTCPLTPPNLRKNYF